MSESELNATEPSSGMGSVSQMIRSAGRRPEIDPAIRARVERAATASWRSQLRRRARRRWGMAIAAGLGLVAILFGTQRWQQQPVAPHIAASVEVIQGQVWLISASGRSALSGAEPLLLGAEIEIGSGAHLALRSVQGSSIRLDQQSRLVWLDAHALRLESGSIYVDNPSGTEPWSVSTPLLQLRDIGTRFMVRHRSASGSSVLVRDGLVEVGDDKIRLAEGERLDVDSLAQAQRSTHNGHGAEWDWVVAAAMPPQMRGRPVIEFLRWYAHEAGLALSVDADQDLLARLDAPMQGELADLSAPQWLEVAKLAADFQLTTDPNAGELRVHSTR